MYCSKCGELLVDSAMFCHNCGEKVNSVADAADAPAPKKMPDPSFGARFAGKAAVPEIPKSAPHAPEPVPVQEPAVQAYEAPAIKKPARESLIPVLEIRQEPEELPPAVQTASPEQHPMQDIYSSSEEGGDFAIRIIDYDETPYHLAVSEESSQPAKQAKKKILPVAIIGVLLILIIFAVLTIALPEVKPFKNFRNMLGLVQTQTDVAPVTTLPESTVLSTTEPSTQKPTVAHGTLLKSPATPSLITSGKVYFDAHASESFASLETEIRFMADFTDENETVFYIPAADDKPEIIYTVDGAEETYSSYTGAYGMFYTEDESESLADAPDELLLCMEILGFSFHKGYEGDFEARGSEELESGTAHIYAMNDGESETLVWIDTNTGAFVKAENNGEELFSISEVKAGHEVQIPDYKNNIIEE